MIVSPKKETAQVKVEDTQIADTKAPETKIADKKPPQKQSPKKAARKMPRWAIGLVAAGLLAVPTTLYISKTRSQPKVDAIASHDSAGGSAKPDGADYVERDGTTRTARESQPERLRADRRVICRTGRSRGSRTNRGPHGKPRCGSSTGSS